MKETLDVYREIDEGILIEFNLRSDDNNGVKSFNQSYESYESFDKLDFPQQAMLLKKWLNIWKLHYYARPREDFSMDEAYKEAHQKGFRGVIVEDLS